MFRQTITADGLVRIFYWSLAAVFLNRRENFEVFDQAFGLFWRRRELLDHLPGALEQIVDTPVHADVVVLEVHGAKPRIVPLDAMALSVGVEEAVLGDPVDLPVERHRILL